MNCPQPQQLQALLDETLPAEEQPTIQAHLETCAICQQAMERLAAGGATWDKTAEHLTPQPMAGDTAMFDVVQKLYDAPTSAEQTQATPATPPVDVDLSFLQPSQKPGALGRLDEYEILSVIGKGGFGIVLKAFDEELHRIVAIKVLAPQIASSGPARERFIREAKAAAAVTHENIVTIHRVDKKAKIPYLVMQLVAGVTLSEKIDRAGQLSIKEILRIGSQIAEGLAAAHKQGVVHRDIKPANILLENGIERVKITDFGLARAADDASVTQSGTVAGTPMFMSPEQANGEAIDQRSDLFSLGSVLYVMCTGKAPFRATSTMAVMKRVCEETPRPIRESNPDIPDWLSDIVEKLHAKKPSDRYQTAKEVAELLGRHLADVQAGRADSRRAEPRERPGAAAPTLATRPLTGHGSPKRRRWKLAAVTLPVLAGVLVVAFGTNFFGLAPWGAQRVTKEDINNPPFVPVFGGPDWTSLSDSKQWQTSGDSNSGREFLLFPGCNFDTKEKLPRNFHLRMEAFLFHGQGTVRFHAQPRVLGIDPPLPKDGWFLNLTEDADGIVHADMVAKNPAQPNAINSAHAASIAQRGEWFYLEVITRDDHTDVRVNGRNIMTLKHADNVPTPGVLNLWNNRRRDPQGSNQIAFRHIEFKDLTPTSKVEPGWVQLFNGKDLTGWKGKGNWTVKDGVLIAKGKASVETDRDFSRPFQLRMEVNLKRGKAKIRSNPTRTGVRWFATLKEGNGSPGGGPKGTVGFGIAAEVSMGDASSPEYGVEHVAKIDQWFTLEFSVDREGGQLQCAELSKRVDWRGTEFWTLPPFLPAPGPIKLEIPDADSEIQISKIEIKELPATPSDVLAEVIRQGRFKAPDLSQAKLTYEDRFQDPASGWLIKKQKGSDCGYQGGRFFIVVEPDNQLSVHCPAKAGGDFACEVIGRTTGPPESWWGLKLRDSPREHHLQFLVNGKQELRIVALDKGANKATRLVEIGHPAIKAGTEFNKLLVIGRGQAYEVYVNGVLVCRPLTTDFVTAPVTFSMMAANYTSTASRAEFERFTTWSADGLPKVALPPEEPGWVQLFNGKDLSGWETFDKSPGRWKIVDGNLTCDGPCSYLFTKRDDYKDFHFRVEARLNAKGNSGQYFRSRFEPGQPKGYYAQINSDPAFTRTGSLNRVTLSGGFESLVNVAGGLVLDNAWFTQEVIAKGNHIQVLVNGKKVVDHVDKDSMYMQGRLALEHMTEPTRVEFRKIEIKELPGAEAPPNKGYALQFDKVSDGVRVADLQLHQLKDATVEAWVTPLRDKYAGPTHVAGVPQQFSLFLDSSPKVAGWNLGLSFPQAFYHTGKLNPIVKGRPYHVAGVRQAGNPPQILLFVDGKRIGNSKIPDADLIESKSRELLIGASGLRISGVRISKSARYDKDFTPERRLVPDQDTLALYQFDEGQGDTLLDSSGHNRHGKIFGAKWVNAGGAPLPIVEPGWVQLFNGKDLTGWKASDPFVWGVQNKSIVGKDGVLTLEREFQDFRCQFEAKVPAKSWLTLRFRTDFFGREALLYLKQGAKDAFAGALYIREKKAIPKLLAAPNKDLISPDTWFTVDLIVRGKLVEVKINGTTTAKTEIDNMPARGKLAFSADSRGHQFRVRNIQIKELPPGPVPALVAPKAVAEKGVLDFAEIHDADEMRFDGWIAQMKKDGLRPVSLSIQTVNESPRYTAIAIKEEAPKLWAFNRGPANDDKHTDEWWDQGYFAIAMSLYRDRGTFQDANLWVKKSPKMHGVWWGPRNTIAKHIASAVKGKKRPFGRSAVVFNGDTKYAVTLGNAGTVPWTEAIDLPLAEFKTWLEKQKADGWRPEHLYAYGSGAKRLFGGILVKDAPQPDWDLSWSLTPKQYEAELVARKTSGFRPQIAAEHESDDGALRFSVVWVRYRAPG